MTNNKDIDWIILHILFKEGSSITQLSKQFNISRNQIYNHFRKHKVDYLINEEKREKKRRKEWGEWFWNANLHLKWLFIKVRLKKLWEK